MIMSVGRYVAMAAILAAGGCLTYNADCALDETPVVGYADAPFALGRNIVRTREAPIGNLVADAFYAQARAAGESVDVGLVPAGAIRDHNECEMKPALGPGAIHQGELSTMLPFSNHVAMAALPEADLWRALEYGVAHLGQYGELGISPRFLHVSHLNIHIDCSRIAANEGIDGARVTGIDFIDGIGASTPLDRGNPTRTFNVATGASLVAGDDGFTWFSNVLATLRAEWEMVGDYIGTAPEQTVTPFVDGRITMENCTLPRPN